MRSIFAGIAKQKELHSSIVTEGLRGCWGNSKTGVLFDAYVMKFTQTSRDHKEYTDFVLLLESELHNNAAELVVRLTLRVGEEVTASLVPASTVHLEAKEVITHKQTARGACVWHISSCQAFLSMGSPVFLCIPLGIRR